MPDSESLPVEQERGESILCFLACLMKGAKIKPDFLLASYEMLNFSRRDQRNSPRGYQLCPNQSKHVRDDAALWEPHTAHNGH